MRNTAIASLLMWLAMGAASASAAADFMPGNPRFSLEPALFLLLAACVYFLIGIGEDLAAELNHRRLEWVKKNTDGSGGLLSSPASARLQSIW